MNGLEKSGSSARTWANGHQCKPALQIVACLALLAGCDDDSRATPVGGPASERTTPLASIAPSAASALSVRIDGVEWLAEHDIFGAVHPTGYDRTILIAGSRGGKHANEQAFNLNLFGIDAPGRYRVHNANAKSGVAQMANLSPERYLAGNLFGYDIEVELVHFSKNPDRIEARFSGTLEANDGSTMQLRDGYFNYTE